MRDGARTFQVLVLTVLSAFGTVPGAAADEVPVGWELDLSDPGVVKSFAEKFFHDQTAMRNVQERFSVDVVDGVLRMTGHYGTDGANIGDYVSVRIGFPEGIDLTKYPVFDVEWRTNAPKPRGCLLIETISETSAGQDASSYYYPREAKPGDRSMSINQYVPDAGFPTRGTPVKMTRLEFRAYAHDASGEYTLEIQSFRARGFTEEESVADALRMDVLRNFKLAPLPEPWASEVFMFGPCGYCRGPEGYESWYDNVVRCHGTVSTLQISQGPDWNGWDKLPPAQEYIEARRKELGVAKPRGLYIQPVLALAGEAKNRGPDGLPWVEDYARKLAQAFKDEPYLAGWFLADEVADEWLWGIVAAKSALDRADPSKLNIINHFAVSRILRFEPYLSLVMTDHYPVKPHKRDPWSMGPWCREMDEKSGRPHWIFIPAFGHTDWWQPDKGAPPSYSYPTRAELRLMTYLALANGIKGITYFLYSAPNMFHGIFDVVGNPMPLDDPLLQDISAVGEKLAEIGPLLLKTKLLPEDAAKATADGDGERGLSVGVRQLPDGGAFLVVVNESIKRKQGGRVDLSTDLAADDCAVYDLYALSPIVPAGALRFQVAPLAPGDGRMYFLGTEARYREVSKAALRNRALEILRVANLDRLVAERWGVDVSAINAQFAKARDAARSGETSEAERARDMVGALLVADAEFARCRQLMLDTRKLLGRAYYAAHRGFHVAWPGCEALLDPTFNLFGRFSPLAERYYRGDKEGLLEAFQVLHGEGKEMFTKAKENRREQ